MVFVLGALVLYAAGSTYRLVLQERLSDYRVYPLLQAAFTKKILGLGPCCTCSSLVLIANDSRGQ